MKDHKIDWKKSWYKFPLLPLRIFFLGLAYYVFEPLSKFFEYIGSIIPGLDQK